MTVCYGLQSILSVISMHLNTYGIFWFPIKGHITHSVILNYLNLRKTMFIVYLLNSIVQHQCNSNTQGQDCSIYLSKLSNLVGSGSQRTVRKLRWALKATSQDILKAIHLKQIMTLYMSVDPSPKKSVINHCSHQV